MILIIILLILRIQGRLRVKSHMIEKIEWYESIKLNIFNPFLNASSIYAES